MQNRFTLTLSVVLTIIMFTATAFAQETKVGFIKSVTGDVTIKRGESLVAANKGDQLYKSDGLVTQSNSSAGIMFTDGTTFAVDQDTEVNVKDYLFQPESNAYAFDLYLKKGKAIYSSGRIEKLAPDKVCLSTPKATVGVRGTHLIVQVD